MPLDNTIPTSALTEATVTGSGVFDHLMRAMKAHLDEEWNKNRIRGPEYSTVYLGSLDTVMQTSLNFLLAREKAALEAQLLQKQLELADKELLQADAKLAQILAQTEQINAQKALAEQQAANLAAEAQNIPKQGLVLDRQAAQIAQQTLLSVEQTKNAVTENTVLVAQECKLRAEFDLTMKTVEKAAQETTLLAQKVITERAQVTGAGVDADSVIGRQKGLYLAQTTGFTRDAEQKAAKILVDAWNVRRTTDETGTPASSINRLDDAHVGNAVAKLLSGVGAV